MKQFWILMAFTAILFTSCGNDQTNNTEDSNANQTPESTEAVKDRPSSGPNGSFLPPLDPGESEMVKILTEVVGTADVHWVFEYYVAEDKAARAANKGRWFDFNPDGTFESGTWEAQKGYGVWRLSNEPEGLMLYLDSINDAEDEKWEVQGVNDQQDTMTWAGISETNTAGVITKVISLTSRPTKAQFGVE
jgi:hypothetical protein